MTQDYYDQDFDNINFREEPEKYRVGKGEQGVLLVEPYKSEILPHWRFKSPEIAKESSDKIYKLYQQYKADDDFVGMDMARKFLQMGFTRARRYANYPGGKKYDNDGNIREKRDDATDNEKAQSADIFYKKYRSVLNDEV